MRRILILALCLAPLVGQAQTTNSGSTSTSNANTASQAGSLSGAQVNQTFTSPGQVDTRVSGTQTLNNVPTVYAPSFGGTNPCTVSASGGGAVAGFGISLGGSWASAECERRNLSVIAVQALNDPALAQEILCGTDDFRAARLRMGRPCAADLPVASTTVAAPLTVATPTVEPVAYTPREPGRLVRGAIPDWCATVGPRDPPASRAACGR